METVNLVVGVLAICVSLLSIGLSLLFSLKASSSLDETKNRAERIEQDVRDRLDDLVKRAAPSEQERAMSSVMPEFLKAAFSDPETMKLIVQEAMKRQTSS